MTNSQHEIQGGNNDGLENVIDFPTLQAVPNFAENCDLSTIHPEFYASLSDVSDTNLISGLEYRKYQLDATRATRDGMLNGVSRGQMIVGTGGGKTSIAMNFIEQTRGRNLYVAPSRIAVQRAQNEIGKLGMTKTAQRMEGGKFDPSAGITFATWQMLLAGDRYKDIPPDLFSLCVFDEAHHFLGPQVKRLVDYFQSYQLHMTATPDNVATSLSSVVPNSFFRYSSDDLVRNDGFPPWLLYRHDVENERLDQAEVVGDRFAIKEGQEGEFLNMSHRYVICTSILRERIPQGSKAIVYLPSINSSKMFVEEVVKKDPVLRQYANKIVHVDGAMNHKEIEDIEKRFSLPPDHPNAILAVCGKDLWTESLDVKDITDVVLADPCASPRVFLQRIGRGSRPAEGKTHVRIHDVVSTLNRLNCNLAQGSKRPLTVAGMMQLQKYYPGIVLNGPYSGMYWDTAGTDQSAGQYQLLPKVSSRMIHFTERNLDLAFLQDQRHAYALFEKFAERLHTNVFTLAFHPEPFFSRGEEMNLRRADGTGFKMTLQDFFDAGEFFGTIDSVKNRVLQGADALREEIRKGFPLSMRLSMGGCSEAEKEEAVCEYGANIPKDPFAVSRLDEGTFVCSSKAMRNLWEYIFKRVKEMKAERGKEGELKISFAELKTVLNLSDYQEMVRHWANPDRHYNGMGDFSEVAKLNNITASYNGTGLVVEVAETREVWEYGLWAYEANTCTVLKTFDRYEGHKKSAMGPGFDEYYSQVYESPHQQIDALEPMKGAIGMIHEDFARLIIAAIEQGRDYIIIDKKVLDNSMKLVLCEVFGLMGLSTEKAWGQCGADHKGREDRPWNFVNVVQLPDGSWKVPIGNVRLQLQDKPRKFAFNWKSMARKGFVDDMIRKAVATFELADDVKETLKVAFDQVKAALLVNGDDINGQVSSADLKDLRAICRLYGVDMEPGGQIAIYNLKMKGCRPVEKPKRAKLAQLRGRTVERLNPEEENPDYVFGIRGVSQIWPTEQGLHVALFERIYWALKKGEKTLTIIPFDKESFRWLCNAIYMDRMHLRAFGFKGDLLDVVGPVSPKKFTISLEGLEI